LSDSAAASHLFQHTAG